MFAKQTFDLIDKKIKFIIKKNDGSSVKKGSLIATIEGKVKNRISEYEVVWLILMIIFQR